MQVLTPVLGSRLEKAHVKNRVKTLKKKFAECKDLFHGLSGFAWNAETCMFEATHEVWMAFIQAKPSASKWMNKPVRNYGKLYDIYGEDRATGDGAESAREKVMRWQREGNLNLNDDCFELDNEFSWVNDAPMDTNNMSPPSTHYSPTPTSEGCQSSKGKKRKASMIEAMEKQFGYVTESMNKVASVLQEGNAIMKESNMIAERAVDVVEKGRPRFYNEEEIYSAVHELGLHRNMQLDAYLFLINNTTAARSFFGTPPAMRAEVLMKMMNLL
ncbi:hypothetical protein MRB53_034222 [Persea americana]|uniref:Uncharacterized protein n=1 Tax=Persea americana TaxID=3435 RepID=A0ACC2KWU9_PERAE|nr:hypothetical protein MRB53_034222 [Persea americana]